MIQEAINTLMSIIDKYPAVDTIAIETDSKIGVMLYDNTFKIFDIDDAQGMIEWIEQQKI